MKSKTKFIKPGLSFRKELFDIQKDLAYQYKDAAREREWNQYNLNNRDIFGFFNSDPNDRLVYAMKSGLFPAES